MSRAIVRFTKLVAVLVTAIAGICGTIGTTLVSEGLSTWQYWALWVTAAGALVSIVTIFAEHFVVEAQEKKAENETRDKRKEEEVRQLELTKRLERLLHPLSEIKAYVRVRFADGSFNEVPLRALGHEPKDWTRAWLANVTLRLDHYLDEGKDWREWGWDDVKGDWCGDILVPRGQVTDYLATATQAYVGITQDAPIRIQRRLESFSSLLDFRDGYTYAAFIGEAAGWGNATIEALSIRDDLGFSMVAEHIEMKTPEGSLPTYRCRWQSNS